MTDRQTSSGAIEALASPAKIVVASDLTDAQHLLPHAIAQGQMTGATVTLVHVIGVSDAEFVGRAEPELASRREAQAKAYLADMAQELEAAGVRCFVSVKHGVPAAVIEAEIRRTGAMRLIIGTHSYANAGPGMLGAVANALLLAVNVPVFAVGPHTGEVGNAAPRRILHPVSLAGGYYETAMFAVELAHVYGAELTLIHILGTDVSHGSYVKDLFEKVNRKLNVLAAENSSVAPVRTVVEAGEPVVEIVRVAAEIEADWIVMGIERDFPWWSMRNSAAYQVIASAGVPVLSVRTRMFHSVDAGVSEHQAVPASGRGQA